MTARTAVRCTAVMGLGALGAVMLAAPASALDSLPLEAASASTVTAADPIIAPLMQLVEDAGPAAEPVVEPVVEAAPEPVKGAVQGLTGQKQPPPADPPTKPGDTGTTNNTGKGSTNEVAGPADPNPATNAANTTVPAAGTGVAAFPPSIASVEGLAGRTGFGTAANPMSLFGAPQVATAPALVSSVQEPLTYTPAGAELPDLLPIGTPDSVPGFLAALACTVVAGAAGAHVAALRARRGSGLAPA